MAKVNPFKRRRARQCTVQALYQWQVAGLALSQIEKQFVEYQDLENVDIEYFHELLTGIDHKVDEIDDAMKPYLDIAIKSLNPVELSVLRLAVFEIMERLDIPYKVVINEALELAKKYGAQDGHKFVNGVLDKVAQQFRAIEFAAK